MAIKVLSEQLASQIAAGEVVERPSSVVKELVENGIDAGARTINVDVREGGRQLIQISDDGCGIVADEIERAFLRHATSKLTSSDDLNTIHTLGFRGEALAAIAAVSQLTIISRAATAKAGTRLVLEGGHKTSREIVGAPQGTVIAVENLFYNVPARLKFLKSVTTEKRLIDEFVTRYALAYPEIRFRLTHNNRITFQTAGNGRVQDVLLNIYGAETAKELLEIGDSEEDEIGDSREDEIRDLRLEIAPESPVSSPQSPISVTGFAGSPSLHWANRSHITLFVNGRWIKDNRLTYAVIQAYHTLLPTGRYPLGIIFIKLPVELVDVNVHPAKTEIRFRQGVSAFGAVQRAVRQTIVADSPVRSMGNWEVGHHASAFTWSGALNQQAFTRRGEGEQSELGLDWSRRFGVPEDALDGIGSRPQTEDMPQDMDSAPQQTQAELGGERLPIMRVVGQIGAAYIITEGPEGMYLIDQHAAHERILYEQFMAARDKEAIVSQQLMAGTAVHLSPPQATLLEENLTHLADIGFQIEPFGPQAFMVRAVPTIVAKLDPARAVTAVVEDLEQGHKPLEDKIEAKIVLRVCKSAAVKAGQTLSTMEMEAMIQQLEACQNPHTCPHGRPTLIHLSVVQLAKQFGRT